MRKANTRAIAAQANTQANTISQKAELLNSSLKWLPFQLCICTLCERRSHFWQMNMSERGQAHEKSELSYLCQKEYLKKVLKIDVQKKTEKRCEKNAKKKDAKKGG